MQRVRNVLKTPAFLAILAIVMVWSLFTITLAPKANACPSNEVETIYYTNASKTVECGWRILLCGCGGTFSSGCRTAFADTTSTPCN